MTVKAKVRCTLNDPMWGKADPETSARVVRFSAVYSEDKESENYSYSQATPSADFYMSVSNPAAFNAFEVGKEYVVTFEEAS